MFLEICKDALNITIGVFIALLLLSIVVLLAGVGAWLYHISIILGIVSTPILVYLIILTFGVIAHLDNIEEEIQRRKARRNNNDI